MLSQFNLIKLMKDGLCVSFNELNVYHIIENNFLLFQWVS